MLLIKTNSQFQFLLYNLFLYCHALTAWLFLPRTIKRVFWKFIPKIIKQQQNFTFIKRFIFKCVYNKISMHIIQQGSILQLWHSVLLCIVQQVIAVILQTMTKYTGTHACTHTHAHTHRVILIIQQIFSVYTKQ